MHRPLISILLPVKNAAAWLGDCLESIISQSETDWECLLVDDHSEDNSMQLASGYSFFDSRFRILKNKGEGLIEANKTGFEYALGEFITRMDADDIMPPHRLALMANKLKNMGPKAVVTGKIEFFPREECGIGTLFYENWLNELCERENHWQWIWRECVIPSPCWMARKDELKEIGGFNSPDYPEDYDLVFRFWKNNFTVGTVKEICHLWRQHDDRFSRKSDHYSAEKFMKLKWSYFKECELGKYSSLALLGTGAKAKILKNILYGESIPFHWYSSEENVVGNVIYGKKIEYLHPEKIGQNTAIISTLSSIDDFESVYDSLNANNITNYRFC